MVAGWWADAGDRGAGADLGAVEGLVAADWCDGTTARLSGVVIDVSSNVGACREVVNPASTARHRGHHDRVALAFLHFRARKAVGTNRAAALAAWPPRSWSPCGADTA